MTGEFPEQMASNAETFPFDDVIMKYIGYASTISTHENISSKCNAAQVSRTELDKSYMGF